MRSTTLILVTLVALFAAFGMCDPLSSGEITPKNCPICPSIYEPVCGKLSGDSDEKAVTFGSECVMKSHNCDSGKAFELLRKGKCSGVGPVQLS